MPFEEKVVNFLKPLRGTSGKAERQLFNHKRQMSMISNSDFEKSGSCIRPRASRKASRSMRSALVVE